MLTTHVECSTEQSITELKILDKKNPVGWRESEQNMIAARQVERTTRNTHIQAGQYIAGKQERLKSVNQQYLLWVITVDYKVP